MKVCGVCGKRIAVMWPEFWVYKHGKGEDTTYYCSENCMIVADTREMKDRIGWVDPQAEMTEEEIEAVTHGRPVGFRRLRKTARREEQPAAPAGQEREDRTMAKYASSHKLTREENERAVELAIDGKDPIGYLKECGCKNPWASWAYIKNVLKKSKPELYAKLPSDDDRLAEEVSYGAQAAPAADPPVPADDPEAADEPEAANPLEGFEAVDVNQQKKPDWEKTTFFGIPCEVTGMKVEEFEFRRMGNDLMMDYPGPGLLWMDKSLATVKLTVEQWKRVIDLVPKVMKIFGMDK